MNYERIIRDVFPPGRGGVLGRDVHAHIAQHLLIGLGALDLKQDADATVVVHVTAGLNSERARQAAAAGRPVPQRDQGDSVPGNMPRSSSSTWRWWPPASARYSSSTHAATRY